MWDIFGYCLWVTLSFILQRHSTPTTYPLVHADVHGVAWRNHRGSKIFVVWLRHYDNVQYLVVCGITDLTTNISAFVISIVCSTLRFRKESSRLLSPTNSPNFDFEWGAVLVGLNPLTPNKLACGFWYYTVCLRLKVLNWTLDTTTNFHQLITICIHSFVLLPYIPIVPILMTRIHSLHKQQVSEWMIQPSIQNCPIQTIL